MDKNRKTSHILNIVQYDAQGHVVLPATLTVGENPHSSDNTNKIPSTSWVRTYVTGLSYQGALTLTTTGSSGAATLVGNTLNIPTYTLSGLGGEPAITVGTTSQYWRGDKSFQTLNTTAVAEGTNLYYTDARVGTYLTNNSYATQSYVSTQISNLVASAPATLDTLNELATALGNDPNFATTISTALGNRLRVDINNQNLSPTDQTNGRTNLGLGSLAVLSSVANAQITDVAWSKVTGTPTTIAGYGITDSLVYTTSTYANPAWITSLAWSKITGAPAFITSYTETDTLATVTARGATTTAGITVSGLLTATNIEVTTFATGNKMVYASGKQLGTLSGTDDTIAYWSAGTISSLLTATYPSLTELSYVKGVTSSIQTQINSKAADNAVVHLSGTETISGAKTFSTEAVFSSILVGSNAYSYFNNKLTIRIDANNSLSQAISNQSNTTSAGSYYIAAAYGNAWYWGIGSSTSTYGNDFTLRTDPSTPGNTPVLRISTAGNASFSGTLSASNLSGTNTGDQTLSGLGGVPTSRTITINGTALDLSANRSWSVGTVIGNSNVLSDANAANVTINGGYFTGFNPSNIPAGQSSGDWGLMTFPIWTGNSTNERYAVQLAANLDDNAHIFIRKFKFLNTASLTAWYNILNSGNYSSYALPLSGGTMTGDIQMGNNQNRIIKFRTATAWDYSLRGENDDFFIRDNPGKNFLSLYYNGGGGSRYIKLMDSIRAYAGGNTYLDNTTIFTGSAQYAVGDGVFWEMTPQANGPNIRLKYDGGSTNREGILGWQDNNGTRYSAIRWQDTAVIVYGTLTANSRIFATATNGGIQFSGSGYTLNPSGMMIGQYVSGMGYIQAPSAGRVEIWNGATENVATFNNDRTTVFYGTPYPGGNGTINLGSSTNRWATVFTSDLSLSNGIGDYTIVEGENDLFLYNNKQNKVYKFMLQEVDPKDATPKMSE